MRLKICLCAVMLSFLSFNVKNYGKTISEKITVIGIALNVKGAAIVQTDKGLHYIIDGLGRWDEKYYGKKVTVSGKLIVKHHEKQSTDSVQVQERVGTWLVIKKPKWSLNE